MNQRFLYALLVLAGVICAVALLWLWHDGSAKLDAPASSDPTTPNQAFQLVESASAASTDDTSAPLSAHARAILDKLQLTLARSDVRAGEAVLSLKDDAAFRRFLDRAHRAGFSIVGQTGALHTVRVRFESHRALRQEVEQNAAEYSDASANGLFVIPQAPARENRPRIDPLPFRNGTLEFLGASNTASWGRGVTIAILDTGVSADATFDSRLRSLEIGLGTSPGAGEHNGHGTGVAALAAGSARDAAGIAPDASVLSVRITDSNGVSDLFTVSQAIVAAVDAGAKIINISLGSYSSGAVLDRAITYAVDRGALLVAAAGNNQAAQLAWPAADPRVVSVGAIDAAGQQVWFSNSGEQLQLTAPGYGVQTAWLDGERVYVNGTSASAPLVSGAVAAVMSQNPSFSPQQAAQILLQTASDGGTPGFDPAYGNGILNVGWAMHRNDPTYVDTAISSHTYDAGKNQVEVIVQNRSGGTVSGMTMSVTAGAQPVNRTVPSLGPGEIHALRVPADPLLLQRNGSLTIKTQLVNPAGIIDRVPANNQRSSIIILAPLPSP